MKEFLKSDFFFDFQDPIIQSYCKEFKQINSNQEKAVQLYLKIRDGFLYDPFNLNISKEGLKASGVLAKKRAWCVEKAHLMIACCRYLNIPARPGYAIVKNHLNNDKLSEILKSDEIVFHGYADLYIDGKWVKATPAFDKRVCRLSGVKPLNFDGVNDSLFQEFDSAKNRFMEYIHYYGEFEQVPVDLMNKEMKKAYPHLFKKDYSHSGFQFKFEESLLD